MEHSARLEWGSCDQDALLIDDGASALDTLSEHLGYGNMDDMWCFKGVGDIPGIRGGSGEPAGSVRQ